MKFNTMLGFVLLGGILMMGAVSFQSCNEASAETAKEETMTEADKVKRGEHLVNVMDCNVCHSPKKMTPQGPVVDEDLKLSGHPASMPLTPPAGDLVAPGQWVMTPQTLTAWYGPWGVSYAANLTPDATGIGEFTLEQFSRALREGKYRGTEGARQLMPPMPWEAFSGLPDEDVEAIFFYLKSLKNLVPQVSDYAALYANTATEGEGE